MDFSVDFSTTSPATQSCANIERVLLLLDQCETATDRALAIPEREWRKSCVAIRKQLIDYVLDRLRPCVDISESNWAANVLADVSASTTVISLNYDNIAERILSSRPGLTHHSSRATCPHCKMCRILEVACNCATRSGLQRSDWQGAVLKPHGSIAWKRCCNSECCSYQCLVADRHCRPFEPCTCGNCGTSCEPVLVLPSMSKRLADVPEIAVMWEASRAALNQASSFLLFGFSLPLSDSLLTQALGRAFRENEQLKDVAIIDLDPAAIAKRLEEIVPDDRQVVATLFPVKRGKVPAWLAPSHVRV